MPHVRKRREAQTVRVIGFEGRPIVVLEPEDSILIIAFSLSRNISINPSVIVDLE
jgi:hypothetical protein